MGDDDRATLARVREGLELTAAELGRLRADLADLQARLLRVEHATKALSGELRAARRDDERKEAVRDPWLPRA
jgi:predicted  nucleic acid-binding Zn-ribbon protein